jgi:hypothetical protein
VDWVPEFVDGNVRASCSICGCSRRAPDNLTLCPDKRWRCTDRCIEVSEFEINKILAASRKRKPQPDTGFGLGPWDEVAPTFLQAAQSRVAQLIPGWTPASTFQDDFTILPGAGGSAWSVQTLFGGLLTAPSTGVARLNAPAASSQANIWNPAVTVPQPSAGRFYAAVSFKLSAVPAASPICIGRPNAVCTLSASLPTSVFLSAGLRTSLSSLRHVLAYITSPFALSSVEMDTGQHLAEMWWLSTGRAWGAIDGEVSLSVVPPATAALVPAVSVFAVDAPGITLDVTDYVCFT